MMRRFLMFAASTALVVGSGALAFAQEQAASNDSAPPVHAAPAATKATTAPAGKGNAAHASVVVRDDRWMRVEGEKRYQTNCGRCHMAPHKFPPRAMATIIRHMRVRAMITDEDMKLILWYMTQ